MFKIFFNFFFVNYQPYALSALTVLFPCFAAIFVSWNYTVLYFETFANRSQSNAIANSIVYEPYFRVLNIHLFITSLAKKLLRICINFFFEFSFHKSFAILILNVVYCLQSPYSLTSRFIRYFWMEPNQILNNKILQLHANSFNLL